jgi:GNAT superfamily N-acetyltransferase
VQAADAINPAIRLLAPADSIAELTDLLHRAYRPLAERGLRFVATHQDEQITRRRAGRGECYLAIDGTRMIGTATLYPPDKTKGSPWRDRPDVASFGQFAVEPEFQRRGIGSLLIRFVERRAVELGAAELALDTAEPADALIRFYAARGYRFIEYMKWDAVNYRSVVLSKRLTT